MTQENHLVTPKQIAAFEFYDRVGSEYLHIGIGLRNKNRLKIENAWYALISQREILRSLFIYKAPHLHRKEILKDLDFFKPEYKEVAQESELAPLIAQKVIFLNQISLSQQKLFYGIIYELPEHSVVVFFINHIIGNTAALGILKQDFIKLYKNDKICIQNNSYVTYISHHISDCRKIFLSEYNFHYNKLNAIINGMVIPNDITVDLHNNETFIHSITTKTFNHRKHFQNSAEVKQEGSVLQQLSSYLLIPKYNEINKKHFSLYTLVVAAYLKAMNTLLEKDYYFQFLMDYKNNKYASEQIGDFSGDFYMTNLKFPAPDREYLDKVHIELFKTYRNHAIYNYQMYDIDVGRLFSNCNIMLNYTPLDVANLDEPYNDLQEIRFDHVRAHNANFELSVDINGLMTYRVIFNEQIFSKSFIYEFNDLWRSKFMSFLSLF